MAATTLISRSSKRNSARSSVPSAVSTIVSSTADETTPYLKHYYRKSGQFHKDRNANEEYDNYDAFVASCKRLVCFGSLFIIGCVTVFGLTKSGYAGNTNQGTSTISSGLQLNLEKAAEQKYKVLVVVDTQRDYCAGCKDGDTNTTLPKWTANLKPIADKIGDRISKVKYDAIVFTQDNLTESNNGVLMESDTCKSRGGDGGDKKGCGMDVVNEITDKIAGGVNKNTEMIYFEKMTDDWFVNSNVPDVLLPSDEKGVNCKTAHDLDPSSACYDDLDGNYGAETFLRKVQYDIRYRGTKLMGNPKDVCPKTPTKCSRDDECLKGECDAAKSLKELLTTPGLRAQRSGVKGSVHNPTNFIYNASNTTIEVVGQMRTRCVMKGAIHAKYEGYSVKVYEDETSNEDPEKKGWNALDESACEQEGTCDTIVHQEKVDAGKENDGGFTSDDLQAAPMPCDDPKQQKLYTLAECQARIFTGYKNGPVLGDAEKYLVGAGVEFVKAGEAVEVLAQGTVSPYSDFNMHYDLI